MQRPAAITRESPSPVAALWAAARAAQAAGDHRRAERVLGTLVAWTPDDAEAWFLRAIAAGWAAPRGSHRFDEVQVGVGIAIERERPTRRDALRERAARALIVLAEVRFEDSARLLDDPTADRSLRDHVALGRAALRLLDAACELDPAFTAAPEAMLRIAEETLATLRIVHQLDGESTLRSGELETAEAALERAHDRALSHLRASVPPPAAGRPAA
jgi:hypothetical protein